MRLLWLGRGEDSACACFRLGKHAASGAILKFATAEPHIAATINDIFMN